MKRYIFLIIVAICSSVAMAANTLSLSSVSGTPQTEVEVAVSLDNSDAISALEVTIPLGEHLQYVNGSAVLATQRSNGHLITAAQVAQDLRIYVYSFSNTSISGNSGELLRFRLLLGNEPADYMLMPFVVLSSAQGTSLAVNTQAGQATILASKLQILAEQIDYGHIPIRATYTKNLQLKNVGNLPLEVTNIVANDSVLTPAKTTLTIQPNATSSVTLTYAPVVRGAISREVVVTSNAINGDQVATIIADPFSVNELHVGSASGIADSIVTIPLTMNNMEPIVAMQCAFKLPTQLEYVANSLAVNSTRSNGHQVLSTLRGDTLVLALFSMSNQALNANDGEVATFQLRLNGTSSTYYLKPINVILSNITEENMVSATSQGKVTIKAPKFNGNASLAFGSAAITEVATTTYSIRNSGSAPLVIERATFLAEGYSVIEDLPLTIANSKSATITVAYQPSVEGDFSTTMNLYTNDPNNRLKTVALSGSVYEPNTLSMDGHSNEDGTYTLSIGLDNYTDIVAMQYDLHWQDGIQTSTSDFIPTDRMSDHTYSVTPMGEGTYRVIIFSMTNTPFIGHSGELHKLVFTPLNNEVDYCRSTISIDNIIISSASGKDKSSITSITYIAQQTRWITLSVSACDSYIWNDQEYTMSGIYTDTISDALGCKTIETLDLTILPGATIETEELILCPSDLPYDWHGQSLIEAGTYTTTEQYTTGCDSVVHELTLNVYVQTLPEQVTMPIVLSGEAVDVSIPTAEIYAHIAAETWYAPNALITWYIQENNNWNVLADDPITADVSNVMLKYVVDTDCASIESNPMSIYIVTTEVRNTEVSIIETYKILRDNGLWIIRNGHVYNTIGARISAMY